MDIRTRVRDMLARGRSVAMVARKFGILERSVVRIRDDRRAGALIAKRFETVRPAPSMRQVWNEGVLHIGQVGAVVFVVTSERVWLQHRNEVRRMEAD